MNNLEQHLIRVYQKLIELDNQKIKDQENKCQKHELTDCQCRYLKLIDKNEPLTSGQFAKLISVSRPTVSQLIKQFMDGGYVITEDCPTDKRIRYIKMTEKGRRITRADYNARIEVIQYIETSLNEQEVVQLIKLLDKL